MNKRHIFIPSKGRPVSPTFTRLQESDLDYTVFVEDNEVESYKLEHNNVVGIGSNPYGAGYPRQVILEYAVEKDIDWYWMMDDDVNGFFVKDEDRKLRSSSARDSLDTTLNIARNFIENSRYEYLDIAMLGPALRHIAWFPESKVIEDYSRPSMQVILMNALTCKHQRFRYETLSLKEDLDFQIQCISSGFQLLRINECAFRCSHKPSTNMIGGCSEYYSRGEDKTTAFKLQDLWGENYVTARKTRDGSRYTCGVKWKKLYKRYFDNG